MFDYGLEYVSPEGRVWDLFSPTAPLFLPEGGLTGMVGAVDRKMDQALFRPGAVNVRRTDGAMTGTLKPMIVGASREVADTYRAWVADWFLEREGELRLHTNGRVLHTRVRLDKPLDPPQRVPEVVNSLEMEMQIRADSGAWWEGPFTVGLTNDHVANWFADTNHEVKSYGGWVANPGDVGLNVWLNYRDSVDLFTKAPDNYTKFIDYTYGVKRVLRVELHSPTSGGGPSNESVFNQVNVTYGASGGNLADWAISLVPHDAGRITLMSNLSASVPDVFRDAVAKWVFYPVLPGQSLGVSVKSYYHVNDAHTNYYFDDGDVSESCSLGYLVGYLNPWGGRF